MSLGRRVDIPRFIGYVTGCGLSNYQLDLLGLQLNTASDIGAFCSMVSQSFSPMEAEHIQSALLICTKDGEK